MVDVLPASAGVTSVASGDSYTCVTVETGAIECWGILGQGLGVGMGANEPLLRPTNIAVGGPAAFVSVGLMHACARLLDGRVRCWGSNQHGQLGDGTYDDRLAPVEVPLP